LRHESQVTREFRQLKRAPFAEPGI
jgi:hypothetical protein